MSEDPAHAGWRPLLLLATLFFAWGFLTSMNDVLIPYMKGVFELSHFRSMLVQFAFFGAYFVGSLAYFLVSVRLGDPIARFGYQRSAVLGLVAAGLGALAFHPASLLASYGLFLGALFVLGLGFTLLQIAANPYVTVLGPEETASSRLNLCQGFNSLGTTLGPLIGGRLVFEHFRPDAAGGTGADAVRGPYLAFAGGLLALAAFLALVRLPRILPPGTHQRGVEALRHPHVVLGMLAIFLYVGAEVAIGSILIAYLGLGDVAGLGEERASVYVSVYWGGLMIGRFLGAVTLGGASRGRKLAALVLLPPAGFLVLVLTVAQGRGLDVAGALRLLVPYVGLLFLNVLAFAFGASRAGRTTALFALAAAALLGAALVSRGTAAVWTVVGVGLFNSVLWSNVFSLSIEGLGRHKGQASSLLVMAIVGGALLPLVQGACADAFGIQTSFAVPLAAYLYIAWFGWRGHRLRRPLAFEEAGGAEAPAPEAAP